MTPPGNETGYRRPQAMIGYVGGPFPASVVFGLLHFILLTWIHTYTLPGLFSQTVSPPMGGFNYNMFPASKTSNPSEAIPPSRVKRRKKPLFFKET